VDFIPTLIQFCMTFENYREKLEPVLANKIGSALSLLERSHFTASILAECMLYYHKFAKISEVALKLYDEYWTKVQISKGDIRSGHAVIALKLVAESNESYKKRLQTDAGMVGLFLNLNNNFDDHFDLVE